MKKTLLRTKEVQEFLSISRSTVERWEREGKLIPVRKGRTKYFRIEDLEKLVGTKLRQNDRKRIAYYRVSTQSQKKEMEYQKETEHPFVTDEEVKEFLNKLNLDNI